MKASMRELTEPVVFTNFLFLINAKLWYDVGCTGAAIVVGITGLASFSYHIPKESFIPTYAFDVCAAHFALVYTLYIAYPHISPLRWAALVGILSIGLTFKKCAHSKGAYEKYHTLWHVCVFVGQCILAQTMPGA